MKAREQDILDAIAKERSRCLWCLDEIMTKLRKDLDKKVLVESHIHLIKVKVQIAQAVTNTARRMIVAGTAPKQSRITENGSSHS